MQISKDSLKASFETVNIRICTNSLGAVDARRDVSDVLRDLIVRLRCAVVMHMKGTKVLLDFSLTVKAATLYSYLGVVRLFHLLRKGNQVLFIIW